MRGTAGSAGGRFRSAAAVIVAMCTEAMTAGTRREGSAGGKRPPAIGRPRQDANNARHQREHRERQQNGSGVIVYQFKEGRGIGLLNKIRAYALQDRGADTVDADACLKFDSDGRDFARCAEILLDLGVRGVRIISNNPRKIDAVRQAGLVVVERLSPLIHVPTTAVRYLQTKKERMGHFIDDFESFSDP